MRGGRIPWVAIIGAGAVLGYAGLQWRELAIRWRVTELERQDTGAELPEGFVAAEPGTIAGEALARYVSTPQGMGRLLRSYLGVFEGTGGQISECLDGVGSGGETAVLLLWMGDHLEGWAAMEDEWMGYLRDIQDDPLADPWDRLRPRRRVARPEMTPARAKWLTRLQDLVTEVGYDEHPIPGRPGAWFSAVSGAGAEHPCKRHYPRKFDWGPYAGLIETDPFRLSP